MLPKPAISPLSRVIVASLALLVPVYAWAQPAPRPLLDLCDAERDFECIQGLELLAPLSYDAAAGVVHASTVGGNLVCQGAPVESGIRLRVDGRDYSLAPLQVDPDILFLMSSGADSSEPWLLRAEIRPPTGGSLDCRLSAQTLQLLRARGADWSSQSHLGANAQVSFSAQSQLISRGVPLDPLLCAQQGSAQASVRWLPRDPDGRVMDAIDLAAAAPSQPVQFAQAPVPATIDVSVGQAGRCLALREGSNGEAPGHLQMGVFPMDVAGFSTNRPGGRPAPLTPGTQFGYELRVQNTSPNQAERLTLVEYFPAGLLANPGGAQPVCVPQGSATASQCGEINMQIPPGGAVNAAAARVLNVVVAPGETLSYQFNRPVAMNAVAGSPVVAGVAIFVADQPTAPTRFRHARGLFVERVIGAL